MELTRRKMLQASASVITVAATAGYTSAQAQAQAHTLELLAESHVDNEHACLHADHDDRYPLTAGESCSDAPTVSETHKVWKVTYEGNSGCVAFNAAEHEHQGAFVFYTAEGTVQPVVGTEVERKPVSECDSLDEYVKVEPSNGNIKLELTVS